MYGAFLGDIIGSPFEFDRGNKTKTFVLFTKGCTYTDDSVMTIAVAEGLLKAGLDASAEEIEEQVTISMQEWGHKYPDEGYGGRFYGWLHARNPKPYGSYGNGSAMRVSAAGWLYDSMERTREVARATAVVTHNHPEGVKGAEATAAAIFLARHGASKEEIKDYIITEFHYDLSRTCDEIRPGYYHVESCQKTVPEAITAFLEAEDFEDAIRTAVSLGGDTDTLAAITGSIAEAFFGIPATLIVKCKEFLTEEMLKVVENFEQAAGRSGQGQREAEEEYAKNQGIAEAIYLYHQADNENRKTQCFLYLLDQMYGRMKEGGCCPAPFVDKNHVLDQLNPEDIILGKTMTLDQDVHLVLDTMQDGEGNLYLPIFLNEDELNKGQTGNVIMGMPITEIVQEACRREDLSGIVFNPFEKPLTLPKEVLEILLASLKEEE